MLEQNAPQDGASGVPAAGPSTATSSSSSSVAESLGRGPSGRVFVFIPYHPDRNIDQTLKTKSDLAASTELQAADGGKEKFEADLRAANADKDNLVNWWDTLYRGGMEQVKRHLAGDELAAFERKVPVVVALGDQWSDSSKMLQQAGPADTVYIPSHADARILAGQIWGTSNLTPEMLLDRMENQGIPPAIGKVKIFACHGAANENTFVQKFADESRDHGRYHESQITGYTEAVGFKIEEFEKLRQEDRALALSTSASGKNQASLEKYKSRLLQNYGLQADECLQNGIPEADQDRLRDLAPLSDQEDLDDEDKVTNQLAEATGMLESLKGMEARKTALAARMESGMPAVAEALGRVRSGFKTATLADSSKVRASTTAVDFAPHSKVARHRTAMAAAIRC